MSSLFVLAFFFCQFLEMKRFYGQDEPEPPRYRPNIQQFPYCERCGTAHDDHCHQRTTTHYHYRENRVTKHKRFHSNPQSKRYYNPHHYYTNNNNHYSHRNNNNNHYSNSNNNYTATSNNKKQSTSNNKKKCYPAPQPIDSRLPPSSRSPRETLDHQLQNSVSFQTVNESEQNPPTLTTNTPSDSNNNNSSHKFNNETTARTSSPLTVNTTDPINNLVGNPIEFLTSTNTPGNYPLALPNSWFASILNGLLVGQYHLNSYPLASPMVPLELPPYPLPVVYPYNNPSSSSSTIPFPPYPTPWPQMYPIISPFSNPSSSYFQVPPLPLLPPPPPLNPQEIIPTIKRVSPTQTLFNEFFGTCSESNSDDIICNQITFSVRCPLSQQRLKLPSRSSQCKHIACFDLEG